MSNNGKIIVIDQALIDTYDATTEKMYLLKESEAIVLLSLAQFIGWRTRWTNLTLTQAQLNELEGAISDALMTPYEVLIMDCNDVEACLPTLPTIIQMQSNTSANTSAIATNTANITNNETSIQNLISSPLNGNVFPELPNSANPDLLCNACYRVASNLSQLIADTVTDAQTITVQEFLSALFSIGGWQGELLNIFWDLIISNYAIDPNLAANCASAIPTIQKHLYCSELDLTLAKIEIENDATLSAQVIASYIGAINSVTADKIAQWVFIGTTETGADCTGANCGCTTLRFYPNDPEITILSGLVSGSVWINNGEVVPDTARIKLRVALDGCTYSRVQVKVRAVHLGGDDSGARNVLHYLNDGLVSSAPYDSIAGSFVISGEDITPFSGNSLDWTVLVGWVSNNSWRLEIEYIEVVT